MPRGGRYKAAGALFLVLGVADLVWINTRLAPAADPGGPPRPPAPPTQPAPAPPPPATQSLGWDQPAAATQPASQPAEEVQVDDGVSYQVTRRDPGEAVPFGPTLGDEAWDPLKAGQGTRADLILPYKIGMHKPTERQADELRALGARLEEIKPRPRILIEGHVDKLEVEAYGEQLSTNRAEAVAEILIGLGFPRDHMFIQGHGVNKPAVALPSTKELPEQRRVEIRILQGDQ